MAEKPKRTWLSFRAEPELVERIDELAAAEHRSRANWLSVKLMQLTTQSQQDNRGAAA